MARDPAPPLPAAGPLYARPWALLGAALALATVGCVVGYFSSRGDGSAKEILIPGFVRLLFVFSATLLSLVAVTRQLKGAGWDFPARVESSAVVSVAGLVAVLGYMSMETDRQPDKPQPAAALATLEDGVDLANDWVSGRMFYAAAFLVALVGSTLIMLPSLVRRVALTLLVLFHFGGMVATSTSVDPPNATGPWVSKQLYAKVYRPYLQFLSMTNAYHFYSPDPGPPSLLWFAVCYDDGSYTWIKLPERANSPVGMHYQRLLALPEHSFQPQPFPVQPTPERGTWDEIYRRRELGSTLNYPPAPQRGKRPMSKATVIPMVLDVDVSGQYREPTYVSKKQFAALAKRVFWTAPEAPRPGVKKKSVKLYRVTHQLLLPLELARGDNPLADEKHWPFFMGEFDKDGTLLSVEPLRVDPFLYWYIPIVVVPPDYPNQGDPTKRLQVRAGVPGVRREGVVKGGELLDGLEMHAAGQIKSKEEEKK
jgi:hypothetical protein